jgi:hypothetical protein
MLMRRLAAILMVVWLSFTLIGPVVLAADAQSNLAACCRRNGQHHCAASSHESGTGWQAARCAAFPSAKALPSQRQAAGLAAPPVVRAEQTIHRTVTVRTLLFRRSSHDRTGQKRGPPLFFL